MSKEIQIAGSGPLRVTDGRTLAGMERRRINREKRQSGLSEVTQDNIALHGDTVLAGERVNVDSALGIADVFCAVSLIAEVVATLPLRIYRSVGGNVFDAAESYRGTRMLATAPNATQPAHRFWATAAGHLLLWGNAFIEKLRDENGLVSELWLLHPSQVEVQWNSELRQKRFIVGGDQNNPYSEDRVLHMLGFTHDGLVGLSPIAQTRQQLGIAKGRERFEAELYARKPFLSGVIQHPGQLRDTVKLRESWAAIYGGGDKGYAAGNNTYRHGVAVLEEGAVFQPLTAPLEDMQFVEAQRLSRTTIANIFKIPPSYIGGSTGDSLTYQTVESNQIQFARNAITPVTVNMQKYLGFDRGIFPFSSWYPEFSLEALLRGDSTARAAFYKALSDVKAITPNEIRGLENMPPMPDGDSIPEPQPVPFQADTDAA